MRRFFVPLAVVTLAAATAVAQEQGLRPLSESFESLRQRVGTFAPAPASTPTLPEELLKALPSPDRATLDYLASRVPGLPVDKVRLVSPEVAFAFLQKASEQKLTYLQFFSGETFKRDEIYYTPAEVIAAVDRKFATGTVPLSGTTTDGQPFRMVAFLGGRGVIHYLYDQRQDFQFKDALADRNFKIGNDGHIEARIEGPADLSVRGLSVEAFMGMFTDIQRIAQTSTSRIHVTTGMGAGDGDISPIRPK